MKYASLNTTDCWRESCVPQQALRSPPALLPCASPYQPPLGEILQTRPREFQTNDRMFPLQPAEQPKAVRVIVQLCIKHSISLAGPVSGMLHHYYQPCAVCATLMPCMASMEGFLHLVQHGQLAAGLINSRFHMLVGDAHRPLHNTCSGSSPSSPQRHAGPQPNIPCMAILPHLRAAR